MGARFTIVSQVVEALLKGIERGEWAGRLPGALALSRQLQVSRETMLNALRQLHRQGIICVSHGRSTRILRAPGRRGADEALRIIRMITPPPDREDSPFFNCLIEELLLALQKTDYRLELHTQASYFHESPLKKIGDLVAHMPSACWILGSTRARVQRWFAQRKIPAVVLGSCHAGLELPSIDRDYQAVSLHAVRMLVSRGHRSIALFLRKSGMAGDEITRQSFVKACVSSPGGVVKPSVWYHAGSLETICPILEQQLRLRARPTAILVAGAAHALTVMTHVMRMGFRIPQDLTVVSRDHLCWVSSTLRCGKGWGWGSGAGRQG
jgi:LacI family transcriptional regulator